MRRLLIFISLFFFSGLLYSQEDYELVSIYKDMESYVFLNIKGYDGQRGDYQLSDSIYVSFRNGDISKIFEIGDNRISGSWKIEKPSPKTVVIYFDCSKRVF